MIAGLVTRWIWVSLPYATYGIETEHGTVIDAAPIAKWMIGKPEVEVAAWLKKKGARCVPLDYSKQTSVSVSPFESEDGAEGPRGHVD